MMPRPDEDDSQIDLPPLDGGAEDEAVPDPDDFEGDDVLTGEGDLDDSTGEGDVLPDLLIEAEVAESLMADAEESTGLDVGGIDPIGNEGEGEGGGASLLDGAEEQGTNDDTLDIEESEEGLRDAGEEGPTADGDEVGLEDLPPMDADEEGSSDETAFFDEIAEEMPAPWADAAWEKFAEHTDVVATAELASMGIALGAAEEEALAEMRKIPGAQTIRAAARVGGEIACARSKATIDASTVILWSPENGARTIAEVGTAEGFEVNLMAWDETRGVLWVGGEFGLVGLEPPAKRVS